MEAVADLHLFRREDVTDVFPFRLSYLAGTKKQK
jgi:hypothetical protein